MTVQLQTNFELNRAPEASLVICTRNRESKLRKCLDTIEKLESSYLFEVIVIDNNSTDRTIDTIKSHALGSRYSFTWGTELKPGVGAARKTGNQLARADVIINFDDDCYPEPGFIDQHLAAFAEDDTLGFVAGRVELFDDKDLPITILTSPNQTYFQPHSRIRAGDILGANLAFRKSALVQAGNYDECLGAGTPFPCEDLDIAARILCNGWSGKYDPRPVVYHHHGRNTVLQLKELIESYDAGRGGFYGKCFCNESLRDIYFFPWLKSCFRKRPTETLRELRSFLSYISGQIGW